MKKIEPIYISLEEATHYCNYSQEYLSLRARQKKLKAIKFGRNWVTKKEWLKEYLKKVEIYKNKKIILPPENLPIEKNNGGFTSIISRHQLKLALFLGLIIIGLFFVGRSILKNFSSDRVFLALINTQDVLKMTIDTFKEFGQWLISLF